MKFFIKHIRCELTLNQREAFSLAQEKWKPCADVQGFIAQVGGWASETEVHIFAIWKDQNSLNYFMKNIHNEIFHKNKQIETYQKTFISYRNWETDSLDCLEEKMEALFENPIEWVEGWRV